MLRNPEEKVNSFYSWVFRDDIFSKEELSKIIKLCELNEQRSAGIYNGRVNDSSVRVTDVSMHTVNNDNLWIFKRLDETINWANNRFYGFDLTGYKFFQFGVYDSSKGGHYGLHTDTKFGIDGIDDFSGLHRKLSMSILLNDNFEGGEFITQLSEQFIETIPMKAGKALLFPSFVMHGVKPVTKGIRKSLVVWVLGPKFI